VNENRRDPTGIFQLKAETDAIAAAESSGKRQGRGAAILIAQSYG